MRYPLLFRAAVVVALCMMAPDVRAQATPKYQPPGADTLSPHAVAESLTVLHGLESSVRSHPKDAASWYRMGMVAWALKTRDRANGEIKQLDYTRLGRMADTCLRIAHQLAPDSARYGLAMARYQREGGNPMTRLAGHLMFADVVDAGRDALSPIEHAETALELGHAKWLQYETFAYRRLETGEMAAARSVGKGSAPRASQWSELYMLATAGMADPSASGVNPSTFGTTGGALIEPTGGGGAGMMGFEMAQGQLGMGNGSKPLKGIVEALLQQTMPLPSDVQGETYYLSAESLFQEAYDAWPSHARVFRNLAMVFIEKNRWLQTRDFAKSHLARAPWDATAWLALGLSSHRLKDDVGAQKAFDSALALMTPAERDRFDRIERVLRARLADSLKQWSPADREAIVRRYWLASDPLWSVDHTSPRVEFLSRVAYADMRWTTDEGGVRGADTDRGEVYIRYGPPDVIIGLSPSPKDYIAEQAQFWWYEKLGLLFAFNGMPTYGTMWFPSDDRDYAHGIMNDVPVRWDNTTNLRIDALPVRIARFRAAGDSVDVVLAARPAVDSILGDAEVKGPVRLNYWMLDRRDTRVAHDSAQLTQNATNSFVHRLPAEWYMLRAEAVADGAKRAATATLQLNARNDAAGGFTTSGFGMSDLLVGTRLTQPATPRGWQDFDAAPLAGPITRSIPLALVWESYGLAQAEGQAKYELTIAFERERGAGGNVVASIVDRLSAPVRTDRGDNRIVFHFDRTVPYSLTLAEGFSIGLAGTPRGTYKLTVTVVDKVSGRTMSRSTLVEVGE